MQKVPKLRSVYFEPKTDSYYKCKQKFENYSYYDCVMSKCSGRVRIDNKLNIILLNEHIKHSGAENTIKLMQINRMILAMAIDSKFSELKPAEIYEKVMSDFNGILLPKNHKAIGRKSVINARRRQKSRIQSPFSNVQQPFVEYAMKSGKESLPSFKVYRMKAKRLFEAKATHSPGNISTNYAFLT